MQPKIDVLVLCDQVIQDAHTGKNTLVGIFDRLFARQYPATHPVVTVFATVTGAPNQRIMATLRVFSPTAHLADIAMGEITLSTQGRANIIGVIGGMKIPEPGLYRIVALLNDVDAAETKLLVETVTTETGSAPTVH